jgi:hypothetical protein
MIFITTPGNEHVEKEPHSAGPLSLKLKPGLDSRAGAPDERAQRLENCF